MLKIIGKRFAELELQLLMVEMLRNFKIEWAGDGEVETNMQLTNVPTKELKFKFTPLK